MTVEWLVLVLSKCTLSEEIVLFCMDSYITYLWKLADISCFVFVLSFTLQDVITK